MCCLIKSFKTHLLRPRSGRGGRGHSRRPGNRLIVIENIVHRRRVRRGRQRLHRGPQPPANLSRRRVLAKAPAVGRPPLHLQDQRSVQGDTSGCSLGFPEKLQYVVNDRSQTLDSGPFRCYIGPESRVCDRSDATYCICSLLIILIRYLTLMSTKPGEQPDVSPCNYHKS